MFARKIIQWYHQNKRTLPWRNTQNPYEIWISEIILQQTRVEQGLPYYLKFIAAFPNVKALAEADEKEVLNIWQGLGYYSRARNLQHAAKTIVKEHKGVFPENYEEIIALKGIGEYTAAAIASFAFQLPYPVLDGNVYRVISRIFGFHEAIDSSSAKKVFMNKLHELLPKNNAADFNQAIMEFGAIQCLPKNPNCENCVFQKSCYAFENQKIEFLPRKEKKLKKTDRNFHYLVALHNNKTLIQKRTEKDIWQGLYEFPLLDSKKKDKGKIILTTSEKKHLLSHQNIFYRFTITEVKSLKAGKNQLKIDLHTIEKFPFPKIIHEFIQKQLLFKLT